MTQTNQSIIVATKLITKADSNGNPRKLFIVEKHDLERNHQQRIDIIDIGYEGNSAVLKKYPTARISITEIVVTPSEFKRWIRVRDAADK